MSYQVQARPIPAVTTTVLITLFFGIFGLIPASIHSSRAQEYGQATIKYWQALDRIRDPASSGDHPLRLVIRAVG